MSNVNNVNNFELLVPSRPSRLKTRKIRPLSKDLILRREVTWAEQASKPRLHGVRMIEVIGHSADVLSAQAEQKITDLAFKYLSDDSFWNGAIDAESFEMFGTIWAFRALEWGFTRS